MTSTTEENNQHERLYMASLAAATKAQETGNDVEVLTLGIAIARLEGLTLPKGYLFKANLANAVLTGAYLVDANLTGANLEDAILIGANLEDAILTGANMHGVYLRDARLPLSFFDAKNWKNTDPLNSVKFFNKDGRRIAGLNFVGDPMNITITPKQAAAGTTDNFGSVASDGPNTIHILDLDENILPEELKAAVQAFKKSGGERAPGGGGQGPQGGTQPK